MHLLISGIPATGKTTFARWLVFEYAYLRCPSGEEPGSTFSAEIDQARQTSDNVVIDWGFSLARLDTVCSLIASGVEPWWFDGDREAAHQAFRARTEHSGTEADWHTQLRDIEQHWEELTTIFASHMLDVVAQGPGGPVHLSNDKRWELMERHRNAPRLGESELV